MKRENLDRAKELDRALGRLDYLLGELDSIAQAGGGVLQSLGGYHAETAFSVFLDSLPQAVQGRLLGSFLTSVTDAAQAHRDGLMSEMESL